MELFLKEEITLNKLSTINILLDENNSKFYTILKNHLSNNLFSADKLEIALKILKNTTILVKSKESYLIKNNFAILLILDNQEFLKKYKDKAVFIDVKKDDDNNNIPSFKETISLVKNLSGYGSHLMHVSIYVLLKAQLNKDDCIELFDSNTFTIKDYITAVDISQSTFDRSRKSHE